MVDEEWDVILVGAGQNNFALGAYLGMAGLRTVVCESRLENGGRLASEELLRPGYWHNTLWYFVDNVESNPVWQELGWTGEHHATFIEPPVISSLLLPEGQSVSHHQDLDATVTSISKHSARDAQAWRATHDRYHPLIASYLLPSYLQPPSRNGNLQQALAADPAGADFQRLAAMTPLQVVDELFENDAVKALVLSQMAIPRGVGIDYAGAGVEVLKLIAGDERPKLTRGGIHEIAQVLQRAYVHNGGQIRAMHHVERILVEGGRAVGVRLRDGREWKAKRAVVSNVDPHTTFVDMVGEDQLPKAFVEKVKAIQYDEYSWFQVHLLLRSRVRYALHEVNAPAIAQALNVNIGPRRPADLEAMWQELRAGELPTHSCFHISCPTALDPLQAPSGKHNATLFVPAPYRLAGQRPEDWVRLKHDYLARILVEWRQYATNLTEQNVVDRCALDPWYISGKWQNLRYGSIYGARKVPSQLGEQRPIPELAHYRTPIAGLYQVGVATHPADAVTSGSGRNAWRIIKEDLQLEIQQPTAAASR